MQNYTLFCSRYFLPPTILTPAPVCLDTPLIFPTPRLFDLCTPLATATPSSIPPTPSPPIPPFILDLRINIYKNVRGEWSACATMY